MQHCSAIKDGIKTSDCSELYSEELECFLNLSLFHGGHVPSMLHMSYRVSDYYLTQFFIPSCVVCSASILQRLSSRDCSHSGLIQDTVFYGYGVLKNCLRRSRILHPLRVYSH